MRRHEPRNTFPQQKQWGILTLIFGAHKRAAKFQRGANLQKELLAVAEHGVRIQTLDAMGADDVVGVARAIRSRYFLLLLAPEQQVPVIGVETIDVYAPSSAFAGRAEGDLAEASDFFQHVRSFRGLSREHFKFSAFQNQAFGRKR